MTTSASSWYLHRTIDLHSHHLLSDRQRSERAAWRASLRNRTATR